MRKVAYILIGLMLTINFSFSYERDYYRLLVEKCGKIEKMAKIPKFVAFKEKARLCDIAKYCFQRFALHVCDNPNFACQTWSIVCVDPVCGLGEKYCVGNCDCTAIVGKLGVIPYDFAFH